MRKLALSLLTVAVALYVWWFTAYTFARHDRYSTHAYDLGIFAQSVYSLAFHGLLLWNEIELHGGASHFAVHNQPVLIPIALLYRLFPGPKTLLFLQTLALALAAYPLYFLAERRLGVGLALALSISYLLNPAVHGINAFDFHPAALGPLFFFLLAYALERSSRAWPLALLSALSVKEDAGLGVIAFGFMDNKVLRSIALMVVGALWTYLSIKYIIPHFNPEGRYVFVHSERFYLHALRCCLRLKLTYALTLPLPVLFTNFLTLGGILAYIVTILEPFLYTKITYFQYGFQYPYMLVPVIYYGSVKGLERLKRYREVMIIMIILFSLGSMVVFDPTPLSFNHKYRDLLDRFIPGISKVSVYYGLPPDYAHYKNLDELVKGLYELPEGLPVLVVDALVPHLSDRLGTFYWPTRLPAAVVVDYQLGETGARDRLVGEFGKSAFRGLYVKISNFDDVVVYARKDVLPLIKRALPWGPSSRRAVFIFFNNDMLNGTYKYFYYTNVLQGYWPGSPGGGVRPDYFSGALCAKVTADGPVTFISDDGSAAFFNGKMLYDCYFAPYCVKKLELRGNGTLVVLFKDRFGVCEMLVFGKVRAVKALSPQRCWELAERLKTFIGLPHAGTK